MINQTQQQLITQQRQAFTRAQVQAAELQKPRVVPQRELRARTLRVQAYAKARQRLRRKAGIIHAKAIRGVEYKFETEVAQTLPSQAKKSYFETAYQTAQEKAQFKVFSLKERIARYKEKIKSKREWWGRKRSKYRKKEGARESYREDIRDYESDIDELEAKQNVYKSVLTGSRLDLIKGYFSNYTSRLARYKADVVEAKYRRKKTKRKARRAFAKKAGFPSYSVYKKAYEFQQKALARQVVYQPYTIKREVIKPTVVPRPTPRYHISQTYKQTSLPRQRLIPIVRKLVKSRRLLLPKLFSSIRW